MTLLLVDGPSYASATDTLVAANHLAASGCSGLTSALAAYAGMAGADSTSAEFAAAYDDAAAALVDGWGALVRGLGSLAHLSAASLTNHARAEEAAGGSWSGAITGPLPRAVSPPRPPSALGDNAVELPHLWDLVRDHLEGLAWPNASCPRLRAAAATWRHAAQELSLLPRHLRDAAAELEVTRSPEVPVALDVLASTREQIWTLAAGCDQLADACASYADSVEAHRATVVGVLHDLAIEAGISVVAGCALSVFTGGGSVAAGGAVAGWRVTSAARRIIATLRALAELARAGVVARLATVASDLRVVRLLLGRLDDARVVEREVLLWRAPRPAGTPLAEELRPAAAGRDWAGHVAANGRGDVWQSPTATHTRGDSIRIMDPDPRYPYGYVRFHNEHGQEIGLDGRTGVPGGSKLENREHTHIPINRDGTYPTPRGWNR